MTERATGASVRVTLSPPAGGTQTFALSPGQSQTFLAGTPLETAVALGTASTTGGSTAGAAAANGVEIDLARGVGGTGAAGGVLVELGVATAAAAGTPPGPVTAAAAPPPAPQATAAPSVTGATTVHTGEPWAGPLPMALLALAFAAGLGLLALRRRSTPAPAPGPAGVPAADVASAGPARRDLLRSPSGSGPGPAAPPSGRGGEGR